MGKIQKVLVTGGAGFIGSVLVKRLVDEGYKITVIDNLSRGSLENLENYIDQIKFIKHDLRMPIMLNSSYDVVFDLAAKIYGITKLYEDEAGFINDNLRILLNVLEAVKNRTKHYFYISSSCVYNFDGCPVPHKEEDAIKIPKTAYDQSKRFAEEIVKIYAQQHGFSYSIIRPFNVYGPKEGEEAPHVITDFMDRLVDAIQHNKKRFWMLGTGTQTRSFTYVKDLVDALIFLMKKQEKNITINIGTGRETTINELLDLMLTVSGGWRFRIEHKPPIPQDVQRRCPDISLIKKLGWKPKYSLEKGLKETWDAKVATIKTSNPQLYNKLHKRQERN